MKKRSACGATLIELVIGSALLGVIMMATNSIVSASDGVARSTNTQGAAAMHANRALGTLSDTLRRGSIASVRLLNGAYFGDGAVDGGYQIREVTNYRGSPVLSSLIKFRLDIPGGATSGDILRTQDGVDEVVATGVTAFSVSRSGNLFTLDVRTRSGPNDDRGRVSHATTQIAARNP